ERARRLHLPRLQRLDDDGRSIATAGERLGQRLRLGVDLHGPVSVAAARGGDRGYRGGRNGRSSALSDLRAGPARRPGLRRLGRLDVLVNNAGGQFLSPAEAITAKGFRTVIELNVQGTWQMTHAAATRAFIPQGGGKVISITLSPHNGMPGMVHSGAARAAVENMTRTLSVEWARFGVKLSALAAGQFDTEVLRTKYPREVAENITRTIPLGRLGRPEGVAWVVAYLASPAGVFVSG